MKDGPNYDVTWRWCRCDYECWNFRPCEREFSGTKVPGKESSGEWKFPGM